MKTLLFIARRFVFGTREKTIKTMIRITAISILIGSCALALVAAVMNGFEQGTRKAIQGIHPDLIITSSDAPLNYQKINAVIKQDFKDTVASTSPYAQESALIKAADSKMITQIVTVTGLDPVAEQQTTKLASMIKQPVGGSLTLLDTPDGVFIGTTLASMLCATVGDEIVLMHAPELSGKSTFSVEQATVKIAGIFKTGIDDIDSRVVFCSLPTFKNVFGHENITTIGVTVAPHVADCTIQSELHNRFELDVLSWKELYPALLSALTLEKYAMFFILALILLVASMNIASLLFMLITQKKMEIGVLKTMGLTDAEITNIFMVIGVGLAVGSSIIGLGIASVISFLLNHFHIIRLPDVYYVSHLPATMTLSILGAVLIVVVMLSIAASYLATRGLRSLETSSVLKQTE
jgi:lipoprotein-releasing system permease protein